LLSLVLEVCLFLFQLLNPMVTSIPAELYAIEDEDEEEEEDGESEAVAVVEGSTCDGGISAAAAESPLPPPPLARHLSLAKQQHQQVQPRQKHPPPGQNSPRQHRWSVSCVGGAAGATGSASAAIRIGLDARERALFDVLLRTAEAHRSGRLRVDEGDAADSSGGGGAASPPPSGVTVRVAGGWVRDKILGLPSHDVDVALDTMTGVQFARLVQRYVLEVAPAEAALEAEAVAGKPMATAVSSEFGPSSPRQPPPGGVELLSASRRIGIVS
jgi:hypothetical protein